ncbi:TPA: 50S ribosomal protein L9 [Candidatus Poribacteria bacterium]|nr:50S ribosomal protein L9 [Candidatus Poribacteria bacterium]
MEVILKQEIPGLGKAGDVVRVADGYARNYLIPRKMAVLATEKAKKAFEKEMRMRTSKREKEAIEARRLAEKLANISCTIKARAGEKDRLFGSVTAADIAKALEEQGIHVDRRNILLEEPIKELGVFSVPVKLYQDVTAEVKVWVIKEE